MSDRIHLAPKQLSQYVLTIGKKDITVYAFEQDWLLLWHIKAQSAEVPIVVNWDVIQIPDE